MKNIVLSLVVASTFAGLPSESQSMQLEGFSNQPVMPQSRARRIANALENWTMKSGERPKAVSIARDCISANGFIMQRGDGPYGLNKDAMPGMAFWSSINGAAIMKASRNGQVELKNGTKTEYQSKFGGEEYKAPMREGRLPQFITDHYEECELIRKRFGG